MISPLKYLELSRELDRHWAPALSPMEFCFVRFIFDRTFGWRKMWEKIPLRHFTDGVKTADGSFYGSVFSNSRGTVVRILKALVERGCVLRREYDNSFMYAVNSDWQPVYPAKEDRSTFSPADQSANTDWSDERTHQQSNKRTVDESDKRTHKRREKGKEGQTGSSTDPDGSDATERGEIEASLKKTTDYSQSRREVRKAVGYQARGKGKGGIVPTAGALRRIWVDLHNEHNPNLPCAPLPDKSIQMLRSYAKEFNTRLTGYEWTDFLGWLFKNWNQMMATSLGWMTKSPECPTPGMVAGAKLRAHLESAWRDREELEAIYAMTPRERDIQFLMKDRRVTRDVAEKMSKERKDSVDAAKRVTLDRAKLEMREEELHREQMRFAVEKKRNEPKVKINMTEEDEEEFIAGMHRSKGERREREREKIKRKALPKDNLSSEGDIPDSFPDWDE